MADLTIPKGDFGYYINFTVLDSDGAAYNLSGYTVKWKVWVSGFPDTLAVDGTCAIVVAASGTCRYLLVDGDFDSVEEYVYELEMTKAGAEESTITKTLSITESG